MLQVAHPFTVTDADHCETDVDALRDVCWILKEIASSLSKQPADLRIYDPYFCEGAIVRHWASLGFRNCYNKNEDFYATVEQGRVPEYDVLITNPPYAPYNAVLPMRSNSACERSLVFKRRPQQWLCN